ncbi:acetyltransferase [Flavobacterium sp. SH_e]|uniref:DapH/DapD/GlmU-related protein n=1 Tax=Flavobacterium TaxID=237 RepID=UPI0021E491CF|nr:DapH/DapD/GlmU-related protein [Flavobacterium sp. SH_e]MCV2483989.1 acetyltransferase [Flavobacterium sp. SH_e]
MLERYGFLGFFKLGVSLIYTKVFFKQARLIRLPFDIRNKKFIEIGKKFTSGVGCRIEAYPENKEKVVFIGENVQINDYVHISGMKGVRLGNNVLIASKVFISDLNHGNYSDEGSIDSPDTPPSERKLYAKPIIIEDNVWLGEFVSVLPGVTIGKGSIVGANSVVSRSLPPNVIAVGTPARVVKKYNFDTKKWDKV